MLSSHQEHGCHTRCSSWQSSTK